jgi:hypothetical protein
MISHQQYKGNNLKLETISMYLKISNPSLQDQNHIAKSITGKILYCIKFSIHSIYKIVTKSFAIVTPMNLFISNLKQNQSVHLAFNYNQTRAATAGAAAAAAAAEVEVTPRKDNKPALAGS